MKHILFTLYEGDYHYGVAALVNSAIRGDFDGAFCIFHRGPLPPWTAALTKIDDQTFEVAGRRIIFHQVNTETYLGYEKPRIALEILDLYPDCQTVIYADPDLVMLAEWSFFRDWIAQGVSYCLDSNFPYLPADHPWRKTWGGLLEFSTGKKPQVTATYPNSGFVSARRADRAFLEDWHAITEKHRRDMGKLTRVRLSERYLPIVGDQDLMAAALMGWTGEKSVLGPEGMGFTGHHFIISHDISQPKAWRRRFFYEALKGNPPPRAAEMFLYASAVGPIKAWSNFALRKKRFYLLLAKLLTRVWQRHSA